ncbi:otoferlin-like [Liolophura sinensis]|uniref:otoferlin-like n=1 Tax=Liolophura sinensis TaxID=3198878 RepID=UPI00315924CA
MDRQRAKFIVRIYRAEGLPRMNTGIMSNVKKAFSGEFSSKDFVDPYVQVSFAGLKGKTSVKKGTHEPMWNEQVVFTEMFPPLCRRVKIQLRDHESVNYDVIGTHFLDLAKISDEGEKGFLPTFGPCWVNLYGSPRNFSLMNEHTHLNDGLGEGVSYRGRLLIAVKTEILENVESWPAAVEVESALPISENAAGRKEEYFLFGTILEACMIDRRYGERPIHFEMSIGNAGNVLDGYHPRKHKDDGSSSEGSEQETESEDEEEVETPRVPKWHSVTPPARPVTRDLIYYHMPYQEDKPCVYINELFEDHRRRMTNTNILEKIAEKLEDSIEDVNEMLQQERPFPEKRLRGLFEELGAACSKFVSLVKGTGGGAASGKTVLDKKRHLLLVREMDHLSTLARTMKATVTKSNIKEKLKAANNYLQKLRNLAVEPQHALPDIFIWMVFGQKRIAYQRILAKDIIYSVVDEEKGKNCGKVITLLLKLPGKKASGQSGWSIQAKLQVYLWLGLIKHKKDFLSGLPKGYEENADILNASKPNAFPPLTITYIEKQTFQLRAHMYQARSIVGSDASGLSDPFARVCFCDQSLSTQVIDETLSPTWDELLIMKEVIMYGVMEEILDDPPTIIVELFDQDKVGKSEFIGRALTKPVVKMSNEKYTSPKFPPRLEWWDIYRGQDKAGELLACFELLQLAPFGDLSGEDLPPMEIPDIGQDRGPVMPVPKGIRPILSKHRIEVLFWGVRDLKRVQLTSVDQPRVEIECAGQVLQSVIITNYKKNPNFFIPVKFFDVELPENELYCPPITIRCHDCRNFGRFVLVGTHVINSLQRFVYIPTTKSAKAALNKLFPGRAIDGGPRQVGQASVRAEDVAITMDERRPLINRDPVVTIDTMTAKQLKTESNKRRKKKDGVDTEAEMDMDALDWWSKYFASIETLIEDKESGHLQEHEKNREEQSGDPLDLDNKPVEAQGEPGGGTHPPDSTPYGTIPNGTGGPTSGGSSPENEKEAKKMEKELKKMEKKDREEKKGFAGAGKAANLANKMSPKGQRKKGKGNAFTAQLKSRVQLNIGSRFNKMFRDDDDYFASVDDENENIEKIRVYPNELESQSQFQGFKDWLDTFELYRGKNTGNEETDESRVVGKFKGSLKIYKIPLPKDIEDTTVTGGDPQYGLFQGLPSNDPLRVLVRVYVVKANDLHPADINGKADPYVVIRLGQKTTNDKDNYVSKQLNPIFGKCFEFDATFPMESLLTVQIYDWDLVGMDDLIGETKIDLENRFYSRHRATCGLAKTYELHGYNAWRDPQKPTQILAKLAKDNKLDGPHYQPGKVRVGNRIFTAPNEIEDESGVMKATDEHLALAVLNNWAEIPNVGCQLVPEHVETRPLYNPKKPGIEQGKVELWVDMFPMDMPPPGPPVDISPRKPKSYELRCIIWNTDDVILEDDAFFTGEKMSDIYVKGWLKGPEDTQATDIHYRSLTGEGNFNWRFIYPFDYLVAEEKIVISRKETILSWDETETKIPPRLNLQVWDADSFSADDFLGSLTLDLTRFPRGAKSAKQCNLDMLKTDGTVPQMNLFKQNRVKGWWPFAVKSDNSDEFELTGKVEAELHLMTSEEAEKHPAGLGRNEPEPLEKPNRPDTSFIWFLSPLKSLRYIFWHNYKWMLLKILLFALLVALIALFFYAMPGYTVKKMFGA